MDKAKAVVIQNVDKLEKFLVEGKDPVSKFVGTASDKTGVKRSFLVIGTATVLLLSLLMSDVFHFMATFIGFAYPAVMSIQAVETPNHDDDKVWLIYWTVFGAFSCLEFFIDTILSLFPWYYLFKVLLLVWCVYPGPHNGSLLIYKHVIRKLAGFGRATEPSYAPEATKAE